MRAEDVPASLAETACPEFAYTPWQSGGRLGERRVAVVSTAGLMHQGDPPFTLGSADYRVIDADSDRPVQMSHISTNFDRSGFVQDQNVVLPLERLAELAADGAIGAMARYHYSFMGATDPAALEPAAADLAEVLRAEGVDLVLGVPV